MLIDHVGAVFFPHLFILRLIGRIAFPLFAWMIAEGYFHTHDRPKYILRLSIFAIISQWPFVFAFSEPTFFGYLNIGVTLVLGLCAIWAVDRIHSRPLALAVVALCAIIAEWLNCDYGAYGVATICLFFLYRDKSPKLFRAQTVLVLIYTILTYVTPFSPGTGYFSPQAASLMALPVIYFYSDKKGADSKWFFYGFYPVHLLLIGIINQFIG
jgi:hypothetical protein